MTDQNEPWIDEMLNKNETKMTEKQANIVKAAIEIFSEKGYAASSTSEIAQRAGVAEGTIFRHYKTKKDLLLTIITPTIVKLITPFVMREFRDVLKTEYTNFEQFVRSFTENRVEFALQNKKLFKIVIQELPFQPDLQSQLQELVVTLVKNQVSSIVEHFKREGQIVQLPTDTIIRMMISVIGGYILTRTFLPVGSSDAWDDKSELDATITFLIKGLTP
ncbi:TetR/AcrR family transcriptional regulator [Paenibacillus marinisediminis]